MASPKRKRNIPLVPFHCFGCGESIGFTTPGEAKRMNTRSHVYCNNCKDAPVELSERQQDLLNALNHLRVQGVAPTFSAASRLLGISRTRTQQIGQAIRARGDGALLDAAMGFNPEETTETGARAGIAPTSPPPVPTPVTSPPPTPASTDSNPTTGDPARAGAEFIV